MTELIKVGSVKSRDGEYVIDREFFRQGYIFKDEDAYLNRKDKPCYVPELVDAVYTAEDFLELCNGQQDFADELFYEVDWQMPETLAEEMFTYSEWVECEDCGKLVNYADGLGDKSCPFCGKAVEV